MDLPAVRKFLEDAESLSGVVQVEGNGESPRFVIAAGWSVSTLQALVSERHGYVKNLISPLGGNLVGHRRTGIGDAHFNLAAQAFLDKE